MAARKTNPSDTPAEQQQKFDRLAVAPKIKPVRKLSAAEMEIFESIVSSREQETWMPHDVRLATELAKMMHQLSVIMDRMATEDPTLESNRGTPVANPIYSITMQLSSSVQAMSRTLGLSASQRGANGELQKKRNIADTQVKEVIARAKEHEGLI